MTIHFTISRTSNDFSCSADGAAKFFVGRRIPYHGNVGLFNIFGGSPLQKLNYDAANYGDTFGFWSNFIDATAECEGRNFLTLNTYDRARFTFGFTQFAAHVPDGDFVQFFRALLAEPEAADYFPTLSIINGRITRTDGAAPVALETASSTAALMDYLNPSATDVEDQEVIAAAKFIHWTSASRPARLIQIRVMIDSYKEYLGRADKRKLIDGRPAAQCCVIADILHQGRGGSMTWQLIGDALKQKKPFDALIAIGAPQWDGRKATLRKKILADPAMQTKVWSSAAQDFK